MGLVFCYFKTELVQHAMKQPVRFNMQCHANARQQNAMVQSVDSRHTSVFYYLDFNIVSDYSDIYLAFYCTVEQLILELEAVSGPQRHVLMLVSSLHISCFLVTEFS